jgi:hypothetical protein
VSGVAGPTASARSAPATVGPRGICAGDTDTVAPSTKNSATAVSPDSSPVRRNRCFFFHVGERADRSRRWRGDGEQASTLGSMNSSSTRERRQTLDMQLAPHARAAAAQVIRAGERLRRAAACCGPMRPMTAKRDDLRTDRAFEVRRS